MRPTTVTLTQNTWGEDADGHRAIVSTKTVAGLLCSAKPGEATTRVDESERWTTVLPWEFHFTADPGASPHDNITVNEGARTHTLEVEGTYPAGVLGVSYVVTAFERI